MTPTRALRRSFAALVALSAVALFGCEDQTGALSRTPPAPVDFADKIELTASPWAVNWDGSPGADGVRVRVNLYRVRGTKVKLVTVKGALEFSLYEGVVGSDATSKAKPFRTWRFAGKDLEQFLARGIAGWGYTVQLAWGQPGPATSSVTLAVRHVPPRGQPMAARAVSITVRPH